MKFVKRKITGALNRIDSYQATKIYKQVAGRPLPPSKGKKLAVMIHLYYPEMWETFQARFTYLQDVPFDLFVSIPSGKDCPQLLSDYPDAFVAHTPNKGRDILPFIKLMKRVIDGNYEYVLKLHSKKSPQRSKGSKWADELLNKLIPQDKKLLQEIIDILQRSDTGIIGPADNYLPLSIYAVDNEPGMIRALSTIYDEKLAAEVSRKKSDYGFFAGSMFWCRTDAISHIIEADFPIRAFPREKGQLDGTFAHALERIFSVVPEIDGRMMYEIDTKVQKRSYKIKRSQEWWDAVADNKTK